MNTEEATWEAGREALTEITAPGHGSGPHEEIVLRYLSGVAGTQARERPAAAASGAATAERTAERR